MRGARCQALLLPVQAVIAGCALVKNAALHRALRRKDNEMNQLILMVRPMHLCCDTSGTLAELCFPITSLAAGPSMHRGSNELSVQRAGNEQDSHSTMLLLLRRCSTCRRACRVRRGLRAFPSCATRAQCHPSRHWATSSRPTLSHLRRSAPPRPSTADASLSRSRETPLKRGRC
jgi:hypothetical protein